MATSFATTTGRLHDPVNINVSALTASTQYIATLTHSGGRTQRIEFTTDGSGAAVLTFVPNTRGSFTCTVALRTPAVVDTSSNTFTGV